MGQTLAPDAKSNLVTLQRGEELLQPPLQTTLSLHHNLFILTFKKKVFECLQSATYCSGYWGTAVYKTDIILATFGGVGGAASGKTGAEQ